MEQASNLSDAFILALIPLGKLFHLHVPLNALNIIILDALHNRIGKGFHAHRLIDEGDAKSGGNVEDGYRRKDIELGVIPDQRGSHHAGADLGRGGQTSLNGALGDQITLEPLGRELLVDEFATRYVGPAGLGAGDKGQGVFAVVGEGKAWLLLDGIDDVEHGLASDGIVRTALPRERSTATDDGVELGQTGIDIEQQTDRMDTGVVVVDEILNGGRIGGIAGNPRHLLQALVVGIGIDASSAEGRDGMAPSGKPLAHCGSNIARSAENSNFLGSRSSRQRSDADSAGREDQGCRRQDWTYKGAHHGLLARLASTEAS